VHHHAGITGVHHHAGINLLFWFSPESDDISVGNAKALHWKAHTPVSYGCIQEDGKRASFEAKRRIPVSRLDTKFVGAGD
jgi:hypothetical protein